MKQFEELLAKRHSEIKSDVDGVSNEIKKLKSEVDFKNSEIKKGWGYWFIGVLIWIVSLGIGISIGNAHGALEALMVIICGLIIYVGGAALVLGLLFLIINTISVSSKISTLNSEINEKKIKIKEIKGEN